jgi:hypothetical protein
MDTIKLKGEIFRGTHCGSVGVYTHADGHTYAGGRKGGVAHGEGVLTWSNGTTESGQRADGHWHGHCEVHYACGDVDYFLFERGKAVHWARVRAGGACSVHYARLRRNGARFYDREPCDPNHAGHAALKDAAQQAGVRMPPTRIHRKPAPSAETRRTRHFGFRALSVLVPGVGPRIRACVCKCARVYVCVRPCVRVPARACICACACVHHCVCVGRCESVCARLCAYAARCARALRVYMCEFVYVCRSVCALVGVCAWVCGWVCVCI